ncbi:MAG: N-acetyl-gamma-glutamyl-phosphate reductase [Acidobacteria bacterium]|nr:N-acetyl-gamma-glutamyl-phosphate reductase [Acidobacteriota bacterium]
MSETYRVGIVGARGHTGSELIRLIAANEQLRLELAGSRELAGEPVPGAAGVVFESPDPATTAERYLDALFLALPDGAGDGYVEAVESTSPDTVIVDISFDHRLDDSWVYGLPELNRDKVRGTRRVANPGCYATAMQLALAPLIDRTSGVPAVFGVSGYSGAGTTPGPTNDVERLRDNLMPYKLVGHNHEREASRHLGHEIRFMPHVHPAFRGLIVTAHVPLQEPSTTEEIATLFQERYEAEPLVSLQDAPPELRDGAGLTGVVIGGIETSADGRNVVVVAAEDNLLKGAAVQALQNVNLALGLPEFSGIL